MRISFQKRKIALLFPLLLTACAGKGSFDTNIVEDESLSSAAQSVKPSPKPKKPAKPIVQEETQQDVQHHKKMEMTPPASPQTPEISKNEMPNSPMEEKPSVSPHSVPSTPNTSNAPLTSPPAVQSEPEEKNRPKEVMVNAPHLGYQLAIPRRNLATYYPDGTPTGLEKTTQIVDGVMVEAQRGRQVEDHLILNEKDLISRNEKPFQQTARDKENGFRFISLGYEELNDYDPKVELAGEEGKEYVLRRGPTGHIYYQGDQTAKAIPIEPKVKYQGVWHFLTDAKKYREGSHLGSRNWGNGRDFGGISEYEDVKRPNGHRSEFEADFNHKKLTGTLTKTARLYPNKTTTRYTIEADIHQNRFNGKAVAENKSDLYFHSDSHSLEGGFFGENAQELAGSFLADDKSAFVVFGAKSEKELAAEAVVDAYKINVDADEDFVKSHLNNFFDVSKLVIDGQEIPLIKNKTQTVKLKSGDEVEVNVCCEQLDYTVLGAFNHQSSRYKPIEKKIEEPEEEEIFDEEAFEDEDALAEEKNAESEASDLTEEETEKEDDLNSNIKPDEDLQYTPFGKNLFIQGKRTAEKEMPKALSVKYQGNWQGNFAKEGISPISVDANHKAEFTADFGNKTLTGKLTRDVNEYIEIDAQIEKSAFSGTARTGEYGIYLDKGNTLDGNQKIQFNKAVVSGGFYGPNAQELGGGLYSHEPKAGAVFGAKKVDGSTQ